MCQQTVGRRNYRLQQTTGANVKKNVINKIKFNIFNISKIIFYFHASFRFGTEAKVNRVDGCRVWPVRKVNKYSNSDVCLRFISN